MKDLLRIGFQGRGQNSKLWEGRHTTFYTDSEGDS